MRNITIYAGAELIGNSFHQLNDVHFNRAPILKSYTMADGSPLIYTAANDTATTEIVLECNQADARKLSSYANQAEFSFVGLNIVGNENFSDRITCYLTGAVQVELISETADICQVRMQVQVVNGV